MEWVDGLRGTVVAIDTAPLIYLIEENPVWSPVVQPFFQALDNGHFRAVTSTIILAEVLVHPLRHSNTALAARYRQILLRARNLSTIPVTVPIAEKAAELRASHGFRTPDAIQLATAVHAKADSFLTNDRVLSLPGVLRVLTLANLQPSVS